MRGSSRQIRPSAQRLPIQQLAWAKVGSRRWGRSRVTWATQRSQSESPSPAAARKSTRAPARSSSARSVAFLPAPTSWRPPGCSNSRTRTITCWPTGARRFSMQEGRRAIRTAMLHRSFPGSTLWWPRVHRVRVSWSVPQWTPSTISRS